MSDKYVYIALLYLPFAVGRFIKFFTWYGYSHVTFSFDDSLESCHAFCQLKKDTPLVGGYINEKKSYYTFGKDVKINTIIYKIPVTDEEYEKIKEYIDEVKNDKEYLYNLYAMCTLVVSRGFRIYKAMHCTEFIGKILTFISAVKMSKKWYKYFPRDINDNLKEYTIYKGILDTTKVQVDEDDFFFQKVSKKEYLMKSIYIFKELLYRLIFKKASPNFDYKKANFMGD